MLGERVVGCVISSWTFFWLDGGEVTGWCFRNLNVLVPTSLGSSACGQLVVTIKNLGVGVVLISTEQFKDILQIVIYIPSGGTRSSLTLLFKLLLLFLLDCFPLFLHFPLLSSLTAWFCSWELRDGLGYKSFFYKQEVGDMEWLVDGRARQGPALFQPPARLCILLTNWGYRS